MKTKIHSIFAILVASSFLVSCRAEDKTAAKDASKESASVISRSDLAKHFGPLKLQVMVSGDANQEGATKLVNTLIKEVGIPTTDQPGGRVLTVSITMNVSSVSASHACDVAVLGNTTVEVDSKPRTYYTYLWSRGDRGHSEGGDYQAVIQQRMAASIKDLLVELKEAMYK